jgi:hypothetical protein
MTALYVIWHQSNWLSSCSQDLSILKNINHSSALKCTMFLVSPFKFLGAGFHEILSMRWPEQTKGFLLVRVFRVGFKDLCYRNRRVWRHVLAIAFTLARSSAYNIEMFVAVCSVTGATDTGAKNSKNYSVFENLEGLVLGTYFVSVFLVSCFVGYLIMRQCSKISHLFWYLTVPWLRQSIASL